MGARPRDNALPELSDRVLARETEASLPVLRADLLRRLQPVFRADTQGELHGARQTLRLVLSERRLNQEVQTIVLNHVK